MKVLLILIVIFMVFGNCLHARRRRLTYKRYEIFEIDFKNVKNHQELKSLLNDYTRFDVWRAPTEYDQRYLVLANPRGTKRLKRVLNRLKLSYSTRRDVSHLIVENTKSERRRRHRRHEKVFRYDEYHNYRSILRWMKRFALNNSDLVSMVQVGTTFEGRSIWGLQIGTSSEKGKPVFWQDSLIHAREWIAGATLLWLTNKLVAEYKNQDPAIVGLFDKLNFVIVPVWNVDGYIFSWKRNRMWRKSRRISSMRFCNGVDLNRNFETPNLKNNSRAQSFCSPVYRGVEPFSEPETRSVASYLKQLNLAAYITIHSFFQLWMYPFGFTDTPCEDQEELDEVSRNAVTAMESAHNETYLRGSIKEVAYMVAGGSIDWVYLDLCVKHSYAIELRDKGVYGFLLPSKYIIPTAEEYYAGFKVVAQHVATTTKSLLKSSCTRVKNGTDV